MKLARRGMTWAGTFLAALALAAMLKPALAAGEVPVPKVAIYPGDVIVEELLTTRKFSPSQLARTPAFMSRDAVIGKVARRTLLPNRPIAVNAIREVELIKQGRRARVVFKSDGFLITGEAVALQSGSAGDVISLRNTDSGTTIRGTVLADGSISVGSQ